MRGSDALRAEERGVDDCAARVEATDPREPDADHRLERVEEAGPLPVA